MKRSEINQAIRYVVQVAVHFKIPLPPFATYSLKHWQSLTEAERELVDNMLGWDVTDFGKGHYLQTGLAAFTFRNGNFAHQDVYSKPYCEKLLFVREGQILPFHFHWHKMEDIINRGGGTLEITLYNADEANDFASTPVQITKDGKRMTIPAGGKIQLIPGESVTLNPKQYHQWQGVPNTGDIVLFEVSMTNDDRTDNCFYEDMARIPKIEEDEPPVYLTFKDYARYVPFTMLA